MSAAKPCRRLDVCFRFRDEDLVVALDLWPEEIVVLSVRIDAKGALPSNDLLLALEADAAAMDALLDAAREQDTTEPEDDPATVRGDLANDRAKDRDQ